MLHVPRVDMLGVLGRLRRAVKPAGVLCASFKHGQSEEFHEGRLFNDYTEETLGEIMVSARGWDVLRVWATTETRADRQVRWVNLPARKP